MLPKHNLQMNGIIDDALNTVFPIGPDGKRNVLVTVRVDTQSILILGGTVFLAVVAGAAVSDSVFNKRK